MSLSSKHRVFWAATALLALANLILFWRFLSPATHWVLSRDNEDLAGQFPFLEASNPRFFIRPTGSSCFCPFPSRSIFQSPCTLS
jgi:hypothetical protein